MLKEYDSSIVKQDEYKEIPMQLSLSGESWIYLA